MAEGITFTDEEAQAIVDEMKADAADAMLWGNLSDSAIKSELEGMVSRMNNVSTLLENMCYKNDYDNTSQYWGALSMNDLSGKGWIRTFCSMNSSALGECARTGSQPTWYRTLSDPQKHTFDVAVGYYRECNSLSKALDELHRLVMFFQLKTSFKLVRLTMNFGDAGIGQDWYQDINDDVQKVDELINQNWTGMEKLATRSNRYYQDNAGKVSRDTLREGFRKARIEDYRFQFEFAKLNKHFDMRSDGTFTVKPDVMAIAKAIDKYTVELTTLDNIEDDTKKAIERCTKVSEALNKCYGDCAIPACVKVADAMLRLKDTIRDFAQTVDHVWSSYKNRDTDDPYCFVRKLPAFSSFKGGYGFEALTADPWHDGTQFQATYRMAARALTGHCESFVKNCGKTF